MFEHEALQRLTDRQLAGLASEALQVLQDRQPQNETTAIHARVWMAHEHALHLALQLGPGARSGADASPVDALIAAHAGLCGVE